MSLQKENFGGVYNFGVLLLSSTHTHRYESMRNQPGIFQEKWQTQHTLETKACNAFIMKERKNY